VAKVAERASNVKNLMFFMREVRKNPPALVGLSIVVAFIVIALLAPVLAPYPEDAYESINPRLRLKPPSSEHFFGTDHLGRDILSRIIFGAQITLWISFSVVALSTGIGVSLGLFSGYYEGTISTLISRITDVFLAIPRIILALAIAAALGASIQNMIIALSLSYWPWFARIVEIEARSIKKNQYIESTVAIGASESRILFIHVLPGTLPSIIVRASIGLGYTILAAAILSFIGVGAQPPTPEWGLMISEAREYLPGSWWYITFPGIAIFLAVLGFNLLGDGLRDIIDPRIRRSM